LFFKNLLLTNSINTEIKKATIKLFINAIGINQYSWSSHGHSQADSRITVSMLCGIVSKPGPQLPPVVNSSRPKRSPQANGKPAIVDTEFAVALAARDLLNRVLIVFVYIKHSKKIIGTSAISITGNERKIIGTPAFADA
jgi:hypothetical protein